jgi:hypothetical protein
MRVTLALTSLLWAVIARDVKFALFVQQMYKTVLTGQRYHEIQPKVAHFLHALDQNQLNAKTLKRLVATAIWSRVIWDATN